MEVGAKGYAEICETREQYNNTKQNAVGTAAVARVHLSVANSSAAAADTGATRCTQKASQKILANKKMLRKHE